MNKFFEDNMPRSITIVDDYSHYRHEPSIRFHYVDDDGDKAIVVVSNTHIYTDTLNTAGVNFSIQAWRFFLCVMEDLQQQVLNFVAA